MRPIRCWCIIAFGHKRPNLTYSKTNFYMGMFKKGLFLGGLLGAAAMWLNATPKGREMRTKLMAQANDLFSQLKESIKQLEGPTKEMYDALVERAVEEYAAKAEMAMDMKNQLVRQLKKRWKELEKEIKK